MDADSVGQSHLIEFAKLVLDWLVVKLDDELVPPFDGRPVVAITEDSAAITAASGGMLTCRRCAV
jgi:hypothetical protein